MLKYKVLKSISSTVLKCLIQHWRILLRCCRVNSALSDIIMALSSVLVSISWKLIKCRNRLSIHLCIALRVATFEFTLIFVNTFVPMLLLFQKMHNMIVNLFQYQTLLQYLTAGNIGITVWGMFYVRKQTFKMVFM